MKKLNLVIATFLILSLGACQMAKFDRVPGNEQMAIPPQFQGNFILLWKEAGSEYFPLSFSLFPASISIRQALNIL